MRRVAALTVLSVALASSGAATGQSAAPTPMVVAATRAALELCPAVHEGKIDLNDAAALTPFGLTPGPDSVETALRQKSTGVEVARGMVGDGRLTVIIWDPHRCIVIIESADRVAARDAVMATVVAKGGKFARESTMADGAVYREFNLGDYSVTSRTSTDNAVSIGVSPLKYR